MESPMTPVPIQPIRVSKDILLGLLSVELVMAYPYGYRVSKSKIFGYKLEAQTI